MDKQDMEIIYSYNDALEIGRRCIDEYTKTSNIAIDESSYSPPTELINGPWDFSVEALELTLKYIFDKLHYSCYLLCITNEKSKLYKLENKTTAPFFKTIINGELASLDKNATLTPAQKNFIKNYVNGNELRILQCIVKIYTQNDTFATEYKSLLDNLSLPNGVYILNLSDAVLLNKEGYMPFPIYRNESPKLEDMFASKEARFIPILSISGQENYWDIPIPNYDDVNYVEGLANYNIADFTTEWSVKKNMAVFRGGPSGCGYTTETNQRLKLLTIKSPDLDVGIVGKGGLIDSKSVRFDPKYGLGMMNTGIKTKNFMTYAEQSEYKYIIHIDGNVNAYRLLSIMATGSLILRVKSQYTRRFI